MEESNKNVEQGYTLIIIDDFPINCTDGYGDKRGDLYNRLSVLLKRRGIEIENLYCICGMLDDDMVNNVQWSDYQSNHLDSSLSQYSYFQFNFMDIITDNGGNSEEIAGEIYSIIEKKFSQNKTIILIDRSLYPKCKNATKTLLEEGEKVSKILVEKLKAENSNVFRYTVLQCAEDAIPVTWTAVSDFAQNIKIRMNH